LDYDAEGNLVGTDIDHARISSTYASSSRAIFRWKQKLRVESRGSRLPDGLMSDL